MVFALNLAIVVLKLFVGLRAGSLAVLGDTAHAGIDALNNVVALVLIHIATRPPDDDHPYGHGKFETVGAFFLSGFLFLTAYELVSAAWTRLGTPQEVLADELTLGVLGFTLLFNIGVTLYEQRQAKRLQSEVLAADAAHTRVDVFVTGSVIAGLVATRYGYPFADPLVTFLVAGVVAWAGFSLFRSTLPVLTDSILYDPAEVKRLVMEVPGVTNVHDIRSRGRPNEGFVQMHLVVNTQDVIEAHAITEAVEQKLSAALGVKETLIHVEPWED